MQKCWEEDTFIDIVHQICKQNLKFAYSKALSVFKPMWLVNDGTYLKTFTYFVETSGMTSWNTNYSYIAKKSNLSDTWNYYVYQDEVPVPVNRYASGCRCNRTSLLLEIKIFNDNRRFLGLTSRKAKEKLISITNIKRSEWTNPNDLVILMEEIYYSNEKCTLSS